MSNRHRKINIALFSLYCMIMLWLLFVRQPGSAGLPYWQSLPKRMNLVPFRTIRLFWNCFRRPFRPHLIRMAVTNLLGNVLLFLPLGFFPPMIWAKLNRLWKILLFAAGCITAAEVLQLLLLLGTCDIDDLILNLLGTAIGYGFFRLLYKANGTAS